MDNGEARTYVVSGEYDIWILQEHSSKGVSDSVIFEPNSEDTRAFLPQIYLIMYAARVAVEMRLPLG